MDALDDASSEVRQAAATALGKIGSPAAVAPLIAMAQHDRFALSALWQIADRLVRGPESPAS